MKNVVLAVSIPEQLLVPLMVDLGVTAVGVLAVKIPSRLKSNMNTARTPALAQKVKLVRLPAHVREAKLVL